MASDLGLQQVDALSINSAGRIDAYIRIGAIKHHLVLPAYDEDVHIALRSLNEALIKRARNELVAQLEMDLSPSTRKALKP